jgi:ribosomal protein S24E
MSKIKEWNARHYPGDKDILFVQKLKEKFNDEDIEKILQIIDDVCHYCWNEPDHCQCWNDE